MTVHPVRAVQPSASASRAGPVPTTRGSAGPAPAAGAALAAWSAFWLVLMAYRGGRSWHFFVQGEQALGDLDDRVAGGLHLYAGLPFLQIGPVTFLATAAATPLGATGALVAAQVFGALAGVVILLVLRDMARTRWPDRRELDRRLLPVALFFTPVWTFLAVGTAHLDDVLALLCVVLALRTATSGRTILTGVLVGLAADAKPWAAPAACLLLLLPTWRARAISAAALVTVVAAAWLPFFLADPATMNAVHYTIPNTPLSALRVLGVNDPRTPGWVRPAQGLLGVLLGALAIRRRRWAAVILVVVATRLVLDPGTNRYYTAGLAVGAAAWDLLGSRATLPWWSAAAFGAFLSRSFGFPPPAYGTITLAFFVAACVLAVGPDAGT